MGLSALAAGEEKVLARVGEAVITVEELPQIAPMLPALNSHGDAEEGKRKLLDMLINQFLSARAAMQLGLDQDPRSWLD
jgi:hypothetical protein